MCSGRWGRDVSSHSAPLRGECRIECRIEEKLPRFMIATAVGMEFDSLFAPELCRCAEGRGWKSAVSITLTVVANWIWCSHNIPALQFGARVGARHIFQI